MPSWGSRVSGCGITMRRRLSMLLRRKSSRPAGQECWSTDPLHLASPGGLLGSSLRQCTLAFVARGRCCRDPAARLTEGYLNQSSKGCERQNMMKFCLDGFSVAPFVERSPFGRHANTSFWVLSVLLFGAFELRDRPFEACDRSINIQTQCSH